MSIERNARMLDFLADAASRVLRGDESGISWVYTHCMTAEDRLEFDLFLVRMKHPLAWEAGPPESRFRKHVDRMVELERERLRLKKEGERS